MAEKYIVSVSKNETSYFLKVQYYLKNNEIKKVDDIILLNSNTIKIIVPNLNLDDKSLKNKEILENNDMVVLQIPENYEDYKENDHYNEGIMDSIKYICYIKYVSVEELPESLSTVVDLSDNFVDEEVFKHGDIVVSINHPLTKKVYAKFKENIYGPMKWEILGDEKYKLLPAPTNPADTKLRCYKYEDIKSYLFEINNNWKRFEVFYNNDLNLNYETEDFIRKELLKTRFINRLKDDKLLTKTEINKLKQKLEDDNIVVNTDERKRIINNIIETENFFNETKEWIIQEIFQSSTKLDIVCDKILKENYNEIRKNSNIDETIKKLSKEEEIKKSELESLRKELKDEEDKLKKIREDRENELKIHNQDKLKELKKEIDTVVKELKNKNLELKEVSEKYKLACEVTKLMDDIGYYSRKGKEVDQEVKDKEENLGRIKNEIEKYTNKQSEEYKTMLEEAIKKIQEKYKENAFEFYTTNSLMKMTSKEEEIKREEEIKKQIPEGISKETISKQEIIEKIYKFIEKESDRKISKNDITNILLCISQGFLTVFAGEPGTGKTSLCNILGKAFGLDRLKNSRYVEVSVEKGWGSKKDFIGYYNPLTKKFDSSNREVFDAFQLLHLEKEKNYEEYPFLITLDEANLSPMEYYWADFMNICEIESNTKKILNLSEDYVYQIPKTLRFMATINYDHTTEVLSPRLLDRAWIILLETPELDINDLTTKNIETNKEILKYYNLEEFTNKNNITLKNNLLERLNLIIKSMKEQRINISPRILKMIKNYCAIGQDLFENENDLIALDYAVSQKLLPLISGYGESYRTFLCQFKENQLSGMKKSQKIIDRIIKKGDHNMKHYEFFSK